MLMKPLMMARTGRNMLGNLCIQNITGEELHETARQRLREERQGRVPKDIMVIAKGFNSETI
jgi:hypothetical protein